MFIVNSRDIDSMTFVQTGSTVRETSVSMTQLFTCPRLKFPAVEISTKGSPLFKSELLQFKKSSRPTFAVIRKMFVRMKTVDAPMAQGKSRFRLSSFVLLPWTSMRVSLFRSNNTNVFLHFSCFLNTQQTFLWIPLCRFQDMHLWKLDRISNTTYHNNFAWEFLTFLLKPEIEMDIH